MVRKWKAFLHFWKKTEIQFCNEILLSMDHWVCYKIPPYKINTVKIFIVIEKISLTAQKDIWSNCFFWHWGAEVNACVYIFFTVYRVLSQIYLLWVFWFIFNQILKSRSRRSNRTRQWSLHRQPKLLTFVKCKEICMEIVSLPPAFFADPQTLWKMFLKIVLV